MKKSYIFLIVLMALLGIVSGILVNKLVKSNSNKLAEANFSAVTDDCIEEAEKYRIAQAKLEETNASLTKISPNASITFKVYYKKCNHTIINKETIDKSLVNLTQDALQSKYINWNIEEFSEDNIILYKEDDGFCNEHYVLKEEDGYIVIYALDENQNETLLKITDIATRFLPESDLNKIKNGLVIYSKQELNKLLEDYE